MAKDARPRGPKLMAEGVFVLSSSPPVRTLLNKRRLSGPGETPVCFVKEAGGGPRRNGKEWTMKEDTAGYKFCGGEFLMARETHINVRFREAALAVSG